MDAEYGDYDFTDDEDEDFLVEEEDEESYDIIGSINLEELEIKNQDELLKIIKSLGLTIKQRTNNKQEIINKIRSYINGFNEFLNERKEIKENSDKYNGGSCLVELFINGDDDQEYNKKVNEICKIGDLILFDKWLQFYSSSISDEDSIYYYHNFKDDLYKILCECSKYGFINIFKHLYYYYPYYIVKKFKELQPVMEDSNVIILNTNGGAYTNSEFQEVIVLAIKHNQHHILDFLNELGYKQK